MKIKIEDLEKLSKENQLKKQSISEEINNLMQRESELIAAANEAAAAGEVETYEAKVKEKERVSTAIFVKRTQLAKLEKPFTVSEVLDAWTDYTERYNKNFKKKWAEYSRALQDLRAVYLDLSKKQNELLLMRQRVIALTDGEVDLSPVPVEYLPTQAQNDIFLKVSAMPAYDARLCLYGCNAAERDSLWSFFDYVVCKRVPYSDKLSF